ncbi:MAG: DUF5399 family protein [Chlamydiales bacterium]
MKATTIDNLDIKIHERYAHDQKVYDRSFVRDASIVTHHADIAATSAIYSSQHEALFELNVKNHAWAHFTPPALYYRARNRFFSYTILPFLSFDEENESNVEEQEEEEEKKNPLKKKTLEAVKGKNQDPSLFERDKSKIIHLLETVDHLNEILGQINAKKLQYQKG